MNFVWHDMYRSPMSELLPYQSRVAQQGLSNFIACLPYLIQTFDSQALIQMPCFCHAFAHLIPEFSSQKHDMRSDLRA